MNEAPTPSPLWLALPVPGDPPLVECFPWDKVEKRLSGDTLPLLVYKLEVVPVSPADGGGVRVYSTVLGEFTITGEGDTVDEAIAGFVESYSFVVGFWNEQNQDTPAPDHIIQRTVIPDTYPTPTGFGPYQLSYAWSRAESAHSA